MKKAYLVLENGKVFEGEFFGCEGETVGEVVFTTNMVGYLETLTDKSYYGQIIVQTFPLVGNYGINEDDSESDVVYAKAYIVKNYCETPSNFRSKSDLKSFLQKKGVIGIKGIDTRALAKVIRDNGTLNGKITANNQRIDYNELKYYKIENPVATLSTKQIQQIKSKDSRLKLAILDFGVSNSVVNYFNSKGCDIYLFPYNTKAEEIQKIKPDGILLSNGSGTPDDLKDILPQIKKLATSGANILGICLGHLVLAAANGFAIEKLKAGHRGANYSVKDLTTGRLCITAQNHAYFVSSESIDTKIASEFFVNVNDKTNEGLFYNENVFSTQFIPSLTSVYVFEKFINNMEKKLCR